MFLECYLPFVSLYLLFGVTGTGIKLLTCRIRSGCAFRVYAHGCRQFLSLPLLLNRCIKVHGLVRCYLPWTAQHNKQALAYPQTIFLYPRISFHKKLGLRVPASILHKTIAGRYRPVRVAVGPITARYRLIKNASGALSADQVLLPKLILVTPYRRV